MTIWDDLYKDLVKSELRQDGVSPLDGEFRTVEAKVDELRKRVGLDAVQSMTKEASMRKSAADSGRDKQMEQCAIDAKSYASGLVDLRRAGITLRAVMDDLKNKFHDKLELIRDMENELEEFVQKQLDKYKVDSPAPIPVLYNKPEGGQRDEDNNIFENISDKLKH
jgi:hypothetical protein